MIIKTKANYKEYLKLKYILHYRKAGTIFSQVLAVFLLTISILSYTGYYKNLESPIVDFTIGSFILFAIPFLIFVKNKKDFSGESRIKENIEFDVTNEKIKMTGESFKTEFDLNKVFKIEELSNYFLIYHTKQNYNVIPKSDLTEIEIFDLRSIFREQKNVLLKLK
jgi:hypothetical protein